MINIVIPMAGAGSRFSKVGYKDPKPLIPVHEIPMIEVVIKNLKPKCPHKFIFICQRSHVYQYGLLEKFKAWSPGCSVIEIDGVTEGAACTVLKAKEFINNQEPLMIANSDQFVDISIDVYLDTIQAKHLDGLIMTMKANDPKWSFVGLDNSELVTRVVEKQVISDEATVGIYNYRSGCDFVRAAELMILSNERVNGEFYVAPVYNLLIKEDKKIGIYNVGSEGQGMYGLGTPDDLNKFISNDVSSKIKGLM